MSDADKTIRARRWPVISLFLLGALALTIAIGLTFFLSSKYQTNPPKPGETKLLDGLTPSSATSRDSAALKDATTTEYELDFILSKAKSRIQIGPTWAWAPDRNDQSRFPYFVKHNESRWNLELSPSKIEPGTIYEQTVHTEEGGVVSEYLFFDKGKITWWFDGRGDQYSEFKSPSVRKKKVMKLFLAVHDGKSGWVPIDKSKEMPLDHGLSVGIILEDGSQRFW